MVDNRLFEMGAFDMFCQKLVMAADDGYWNDRSMV